MRKRNAGMKGKRALSVFTAAIMLTAEVATVAGAASIGTKPLNAEAALTEKKLQYGKGTIADEDMILYGAAADGTDYYSGNGKYRVLDASADNNGDSGALFVLSDNLWSIPGTVRFDYTRNPISSVWQGSDAQEWCEDFKNDNFNGAEKGALRAIEKNDAAYHSYGASVLDGDKVFFLSVEEADDYITGTKAASYNDGRSWWWTRSPYDDDEVGRVDISGGISGKEVDDYDTARPAFNIETSAILFSSDSEWPKPNDDELAPVPTATADVDTWRLTLLTSGLSATCTSVEQDETEPEKILLGGYTKTETGDRTSVMVTNMAENPEILYYGKLNDSGEDVFFILPDALSVDNWGTDYKVYLVREDIHEENSFASDLAGTPFRLSAPGADTDETDDEDDPVIPKKDDKKSDSSSSKSSSKSHNRHVHDYEWVMTQEPTPYEDGVYEYRCKGCGHVADTAKADGTAALMNAMKKAIEAAPENGTVRLDCGYYMSLNRAVAEAHDLRPDVTVIFTFLDKGVRKELTIPAGTLIVPMLNEYGWAGFLFIGGQTGVTLTEVK